MAGHGSVIDLALVGCLQRLPISELSPPLRMVIGWVQRSPAPLLPPSESHCKWAKSPRSNRVCSLSLQPRWGVKVGLRGGLGQWLGYNRKGSRFAFISLQSGAWFLLVPESPASLAEAGGLREGSQEVVERMWGPLSTKPGLWSPGAGDPLPQPRAQEALSLRGWTGQHSCGPGPLPPACLNLAPASGDPAPPPPHAVVWAWRACLSLGRGAPCVGDRGGCPT